MERILKFRGKNIHTGEWLYGDYHREGKTHYITKPEQYRMACKHYSKLSGHCYKQSGEIGRRLAFINGKFMWVATGYIDFNCTPDCNCARMKRYDKLNANTL